VASVSWGSSAGEGDGTVDPAGCGVVAVSAAALVPLDEDEAWQLVATNRAAPDSNRAPARRFMVLFFMT
jgi:hypothetical protein